MHKINVLPVGDSAVLVDLADLNSALALFQQLNSQQPSGVIELVPAAKTILISFDCEALKLYQLRAWIQAEYAKIQDNLAGNDEKSFAINSPLVEVPANYDGQDLGQVADYLGISTAELIERHTGTEFIAAFAGFAPGFVYLSNGDPVLIIFHVWIAPVPVYLLAQLL